jgi:hypothetical protein
VLIDIFDKQIEKIKNMKKLIFGVALIGIASIGFSFMKIENKNGGDQPNCILIQVYKTDPSTKTKTISNVYETIYAPNATEASNIAKKKYPNAYAVWIEQAGQSCK